MMVVRKPGIRGLVERKVQRTGGVATAGTYFVVCQEGVRNFVKLKGVNVGEIGSRQVAPVCTLAWRVWRPGEVGGEGGGGLG